jgi:TolB-like protein
LTCDLSILRSGSFGSKGGRRSGKPPEPSKRRRTRYALGGLGLLLLLATTLLGGLVVYAIRQRPQVEASRNQIRSVAIVPLENFTGDPSQEYFVDGMTDALITELAQVRDLKVISRTSVMHYKGTKKNLPEIARELNVDAVLEGSVGRSGDEVKITMQLIRASTDTHLWAASDARVQQDVLRLQSEVARTDRPKSSAACHWGSRK